VIEMADESPPMIQMGIPQDGYRIVVEETAVEASGEGGGRDRQQ
jgi:hypothetical protein